MGKCFQNDYELCSQESVPPHGLTEEISLWPIHVQVVRMAKNQWSLHVVFQLKELVPVSMHVLDVLTELLNWNRLQTVLTCIQWRRTAGLGV